MQVEGIVEIRGSVPAEDFVSADVLYAYSQEDSATWFLIKRLDSVVQDDVLATWDTTTITDGVYRLKLVVVTQGGAKNEVIINDIRVSNYTHGIEPLTTTSLGNSETKPQVAGSIMITPGPTPLPQNPASIVGNEVRLAVYTGIIISCGLLGLLILYTSVQSYRRRR